MPSSPQERSHRPLPEKVIDLAGRVRTGEIRLPKFQRKFVWSREQVLDLLDSISRDYPIGSLLLWRSEMHLASERSIAGLEIDESSWTDRPAYLLDGCQRLSTICGTLYWEPDGDPASYWNLVYDFADERFLHRHDLDAPPPHQVPLRYLAQPSEYFGWVAGELPKEFHDAARRLFNAFERYETAVVTLKSATFTEVGRIFERINTRGTPLTPIEFVRAATWRTDFDLLDAIDGVRDVLTAKNYGRIEPMLLLRSIAAACGLGFSRTDIENLPSVQERLPAAIEEAEQAARRAVDFLTTEIGTPTAEALPYPNQLAVVIEIFRQLPNPDGHQHAEIRRWFWRTVLSGYYEGWNSRKMAADLAAVTAFARRESQRIDVETAPLSIGRWTRSQYRRDSSRTKAFALMLAAAAPVDLVTGAAIDTGRALADSNDMQFHHFFPKASLMREGLRFEETNVLPNIVMLRALSNQHISDQNPAAYLQTEIDFSDEATVRERLKSCLISPPAFDAALRGDYRAFLAARAETLIAWAEDLIGGERAAVVRAARPDAETERRVREVEVVDHDTTD